MRQIPLGSTDQMIPNYCLGTMTWGRNTAPGDAHRQIDMALEAGLNFMDTAEMYPVNPIMAETVGDTETIIGTWLAANPSRRGEITLASKIAGLNGSYVRPGQPITGATFTEALENGLRRLRTDCIDLYQLHWPNRGSYMFRQNWSYRPQGALPEILDNMAEVLQAADAARQAGKIRHFGLSNESAWGTAQWVQVAQAAGLPRVQSLQNEYSLLCRMADTDVAEMCFHERITLLAFSPLAAGLLTGKYQSGAIPDGSRMTATPELGGRKSARVFDAVAAYLAVARRHGLDPVHMALAFTVQRPFPTCSIVGASDAGQLRHILDGLDLVLSDEVMADLDATHRAHPMPY